MSDLVEQLDKMLQERAYKAAFAKVIRALRALESEFPSTWDNDTQQSVSPLGITLLAKDRLIDQERIRQHKAMQAVLLAKLAEFIPEE